MHNRRIVLPLILLCLSLALQVPADAQTYNPFNQRDDQYRLLGLKRAKEAFETARAEFDRQQQLFGRNLITQVELDRARNTYTDAEVNYQQSLLAVLFEEQYISVSGAVKYQADDGAKHVRLTLVNTAGGSAEFQKLVNMEDELFRSLQPDVIPNVYVSLLNEQNSIISQPYEAKIAELKYGLPQTVDFKLLQDLDAVTVFMIYGNGNQRQMKIFLQKDNSVDRVVVQSEQFSQEVELGNSSTFDLTLELFSGSSNMFGLEVVNLPRQIGRSFKDPNSTIRLSQVKFTESTHSKTAALEVSLPDRPTSEVAMDKPIPFYVLVIPREQADKIGDLYTRNWTEDDLKALDVGYVRLELVPRGKGKLRVQSSQLFYSILPGDSATMTLDVLNEGTHRLDNIQVKLDMPNNWTHRIEPALISALEISGESRVRLVFTPPEDVSPGKYEVRVRSSALSNNQPITGEDKTVTVEVQTQTSVLATVAIVLVVIGLVVGIVIFGIRLSRR
jgi:uncharacterized membrane protein